MKCTQCKQNKHYSKFYRKINGKLRSECKHCSSERAKEWARNNRERVNERVRKWGERNPEKKAVTVRRNHLKRKKIVMVHYGKNGCVCCGEKNLCFLTIDHILDNGAEDKKKFGKGERLRYWMIIRDKFPGGLQTLCFNCQWGKRIGKGFCPHHPRTDLRKL